MRSEPGQIQQRPVAVLRPGRDDRGERKFVDLALDAVAADGAFSGYASLFDRVDLGRDVVSRGAFAKSLAARGAAGIRMLFQHDPAEPIGTWTELREDARGLFVRGRLNNGVRRAREVLSLMKSGALDGLSIGFRTVKSRAEGATGVRRIVEADLWEISVVTFPMLPEARIESVKAGYPGPHAYAGRPGRGGSARALRDDGAELLRMIRLATRMINRKVTI